MVDLDWPTTSGNVLNLPASPARQVEGNELRKRPALMSKLFHLTYFTNFGLNLYVFAFVFYPSDWGLRVGLGHRSDQLMPLILLATDLGSIPACRAGPSAEMSCLKR